MADRHTTKPVAVRLTGDERQAVKTAAGQEGIAVNEWLKRAIRERLARPRRETGWCAQCHRTVYLDDPRHGNGCTESHDPGCGCGEQPSNYVKES